MVDSHTHTANDVPFEEHAKRVLQRVRGAFAEAVDALPGHITRPYELAKALKIDMKLAWKVIKVAHGADPFTTARHIPGSAAIRMFLKAAAKHKVASSLIQSVVEAVAEFEQLIEMHADNRATLEMMLLAFGREDSRQADLKHRKAAFTANSYIWGLQAKAQVKTDFLLPAAEKERLDYASLRGFVGLRRIRPNVPVVIGRTGVADDDGDLQKTPLREPLDPAENDEDKGEGGTPLLRRFCSKPLPRFRRVTGPHGFMNDELVEGDIGNAGAITCFTGEVAYSAISQYRAEHDRWGTHAVFMRTPCEALVFDVLVHEDLYPQFELDLAVYSELTGGPGVLPTEGREADRLPIWESIDHLGKGPSVVHTPHVPGYAEIIRFVFDKLGVDGERFDVYRVQMQFPVVPTSVLIIHELPEGPAQ